jgi:catalase
MMQKFLMALLMAGLTVVAAADTVYKWSDSRGQIHYTDLPPSQAGAKILSVSHQESDFTGYEQAGDEDNGGDNGDEPATQPSGDDSNEPRIDHEAMAAVQADVSNAKQKQCKDAKERYQRYVESRRLFRETSDGKREYLTDQQLADARIKAKQAVDEYCS